jgi:RecA/RadA recombinase
MPVSAVLALKQQLAELTGPAPASSRLSGALPTGIAALDEKIGGGVPRGRLTEVIGARGAGKTTLIRHLVMTVVTSGMWVAYIDATRTLAPGDWVDVASAGEGFWVIRPPDPGRGAWCADVVLRSGGFGLVVLDGAPSLTRAVTVRLTRLARESDAALVAVGDDDDGWRASALGAALRLRVRGGRARLGVTAESHHASEVRCAVRVARSLRADPEVPDRRGMARRARGAGGTLSPTRRAATPEYP